MHHFIPTPTGEDVRTERELAEQHQANDATIQQQEEDEQEEQGGKADMTHGDEGDSMEDHTMEEENNTVDKEQEQEEHHDEEDGEEEVEEDTSGTSVLPLSKVKKIFKVDPEHLGASEAAVFTTAVATELFIQFFTEQASLIARSDKRKKLQYKDFSAAVMNIEQLQFLTDTVPQTHNLQGLVAKNKVKYNKDVTLEKGQQTLSMGKKTNDWMDESDGEDLGDIDDAHLNTDNDTDEDENDNQNESGAQNEIEERLDSDHDVIMEQ